MLYIPLSLWYLCLVSILIALSVAGLATLVELYWSIFPPFVTSVSEQVLGALYHTVQLAAIGYCVIVILVVLTGGGTNAL